MVFGLFFFSIIFGRIFEDLTRELREKAGSLHKNHSDGAEVRTDPRAAAGGSSLHGAGDNLPGRALRVHPGLARAAAGQDKGGQVRWLSGGRVQGTCLQPQLGLQALP